MIKLGELGELEKNAIESLAKALGFFARNRAYGYIDRLANAFSLATARQVLTEVLRDLKSEHDRGESVFLPRPQDVELLLTLCEKDLTVLKIVAALALSYAR